MPLVKVKSVAEIPPGSVAELEVGDAVYAVCNVGGEFHCVDGICPHEGGPLGQGALHGATLVCPWHGWEFDACTGAPQVGGDERLRTFPVHIQGDQVFVELP
jgi:nitrite reductase/ring-hydroxylating ferredoxin subunit